MRKRSNTLVIIICAISFILISSIILASYLLVSKSVLNTNNLESLENINVTNLNIIENSLLNVEKQFDTVLDGITNEIAAVQKLKDHHENFELIGDLKFQGYGVEGFDYFEIDGEKYYLNANYYRPELFKQKTSFFKYQDIMTNVPSLSSDTWMLIRKNNVFAYFSATELIKQLIPVSPAINSQEFLITSDGYVLFGQNTSFTSTIFGDIFTSGSDRDKFFDEIQANRKYLSINLVNQSNDKSYITANGFVNDQTVLKITYVSITPYKNLGTGLGNLSLISGISIVIIGLLAFVLTVIVIFIINRSNTEIQISKRKLYYSNSYTITVNDKFQLKHFNDAFLDVFEKPTCESLLEMERINYNIELDLPRLKTITLQFQPKGSKIPNEFIDVDFQIIKNGRHYELIGQETSKEIKRLFERNLLTRYFSTLVYDLNQYNLDLERVVSSREYKSDFVSLVLIQVGDLKRLNLKENLREKDSQIRKFLKTIINFDYRLYNVKTPVVGMILKGVHPETIKKWAESVTEQVSGITIGVNNFTDETAQSFEIAEKAANSALQLALKLKSIDYAVY